MYKGLRYLFHGNVDILCLMGRYMYIRNKDIITHTYTHTHKQGWTFDMFLLMNIGGLIFKRFSFSFSCIHNL